MQYYAPIINENVYTNLWQGPYYGFRGVIDTFALTDSPRRLRGLHLYYHFYSGTKQASIRTMHQIYAAMQAEHPLSLWMSDYIPRLEGLHRASLAKRADGSWQLRGFAALRTVRLDPALGWPDLARSTGVAGVRDLPQGRYVHLSAANARLVLRDSRDPRPALEEANLPLKHWRYRDDGRVEFAFAGHLPLRLVVRAAGDCRLSAAGKAFRERPATACGRSSCRWSRCAMANSSAADKHPKARLLNPWALLPVALGVALVLWLTFNSEEVFMPSGDGEPDAVSVNYAELLLQAHPENDALRLTLIDLLVKLGDFEQARHHLALLRGKDRLATPFYEVELDILGALARPRAWMRSRRADCWSACARSSMFR